MTKTYLSQLLFTIIDVNLHEASLISPWDSIILPLIVLQRASKQCKDLFSLSTVSLYSALDYHDREH